LVIKVAAFDFDGTLVDSNAIKVEGFWRLAARYPRGETVMQEVIGTSGDRRSVLSAFASHMAAGGVRLKVEELVTRYSEDVDPAVAAAPEVQGATDLLVNLRNAGLRLHLNSATPTASLLAILDIRGWTALFDGIHGSPKSKIEALQQIREAEDVSNQELVIVGDGIDDARAAETAGIRFIAVGSGTYAAANPHVRMMPLSDVKASLLTTLAE